MAQFATASDLATRLGVTFTTAESTRADALLTDASGIIQDEVGQTIELVTDDVLVRPGTYDNRIRLPQRPVVSVASIAGALMDQTPVDLGTDSWYLDGDEIVRAAFPLGIERHFFSVGNGWLGDTFTLTITYTHGYSTIPTIVKTVCTEMVARVWLNPNPAIQAETYGSEQITYYDNAVSGLLLTDTERNALFRKLRRTSGSIPLR